VLHTHNLNEIDTIVVETLRGTPMKEIAETLNRSESWIRNFKSSDQYKARRDELATYLESLAPHLPTRLTGVW